MHFLIFSGWKVKIIYGTYKTVYKYKVYNSKMMITLETIAMIGWGFCEVQITGCALLLIGIVTIR